MYNCKNCGANLRFDPATQKLVCDFCDSTFEPSDFDDDVLGAEEVTFEGPAADSSDYVDSHNPADSSDSVNTHNATDNSDSADTFKVTIMTCPQCGGELLTTEETAATFCSFCGSSVLLESRVSREKRPDYIIPFRTTKEQCQEAYKTALKRSLYAPKDMLDDTQIERFRGIYMPYWVYSFHKQGTIQQRGTESSRRGDYIITKNYSIRTPIDASYKGLSFDASASFSDNLSEAIAPFSFSETRPFDPAYLSGFYADTNDVSASVYQDDAEDLAKDHITSQIYSNPTYLRYNVDVNSAADSINLIPDKPKLAMYPVWFLACRNKRNDRVSYAVVNGETGKIAADLPVDNKKMLLGSLLIAIPIFVILNLLVTLTPGKALIGTIILGLIGMILANHQLNLIHCFENKLDDKGYMSIHDPWGKQTREKTNVFGESGLFPVRNVIIALVCIILFAVVAMTGIPGGGVFIMIIMFFLIKSFVKPARRRSRTRSTKTAFQPAPAGEKMKILWKPIVGIIASLLIVVIAPVSDLYYYTAAIVSMIFVAISFWDILNLHNRLTTRPIPQFNKRGGDERELS